MCIVVDICALSGVFSEKSERYDVYEPIRTWIFKRDGKLVFGGSKYKKELNKASSYLNLFAELSRNNKIVRVDDHEVDKQEELIKLMNKVGFDDHHIAAIVCVSKCRIVCTEDKRSLKFLKERDIYSGCKIPKIYQCIEHKNLLCKKNIAPCCR